MMMASDKTKLQHITQKKYVLAALKGHLCCQRKWEIPFETEYYDDSRLGILSAATTFSRRRGTLRSWCAGHPWRTGGCVASRNATLRSSESVSMRLKKDICWC